MQTYRHILLATDLSQETDHIADTAKRIAERNKATLSIVHVMQHTPIVYGGGEFSIPLDMNLEEQLSKSAIKALTIIAEQYQITPENQYLVHGSIKREIIKLAEQIKADLIVVGSHGHSGVQMLLGATANAVLHAAKCDVLSVRVGPKST